MCKSKLLITLRHKFRHVALEHCLKGHFNIESHSHLKGEETAAQRGHAITRGHIAWKWWI